MKDVLLTVTAAVVAIAIFTASFFAFGLGVQFAWNLAIPSLFGMPRCEFSEGVGLALLVNFVSLSFRIAITK